MDTTITVSDVTFGQEIRDLRPYTFYQVQVAAKSYILTGPKSFVKVVQTLEDGEWLVNLTPELKNALRL